MTETMREGGCLCGKVRYELRGDPHSVEYCHCGMCRKASGAPVVAWADFPTEVVTWPGQRPAEYGSSPEAWRGYCQECGGALTFRSRKDAGWIAITVGSLDDPGGLAPKRHIYEVDRIAWLHLDDDLPRHAQRPPPS